MTDDRKRPYRMALRPEPDQPDEDLMDDVFVRDVSMFRAEMMSDKALWMCCYLGESDERISFWVGVKKGRLVFTVTEYPHGDEFTYEPVPAVDKGSYLAGGAE